MKTTEDLARLAANDVRIVDRFLSAIECRRLLFAIPPSRWSKSQLWFGNGEERPPEDYAHLRNSDTLYESGFGDDLAERVQAVRER